MPEGDAAALREALIQVRANPGLRADLARRGLERALARYTNRKIAEADLAFFQELAA